MSLLSLEWPAALTLFAGLAAPLAALYLLKDRRPAAVVPFVDLWLKVLETERARQPWFRLRRLRSLLWQLAMLAALVLALANPSFERWSAHPRQYIAVIDASASMLAQSSNPKRWDSRLDEAIASIRDEVSHLGTRDRAALIVAGAEVSVRAPLGLVSDLLEATRRPITPAGVGSLTEALSLARAMTANAPNQAWLRVFSDDHPSASLSSKLDQCENRRTTCAWTRVGGPSANVAISSFAARRAHGDVALVDISAEVRNLSPTPSSVGLRIISAGVPLTTLSLELPAEGSERVSLRGLDAPQQRFTAELYPLDGSALSGVAYDDVAYAVVGPRAPVRVAKVADRQNLFLDAVLLSLDAELELVSMSMEEARRAPAFLDGFDLVMMDVSDESSPLPLPKTTTVFFDPYRVKERPFPLKMRRRIRRPRLSARPIDDPLVKGIVFKDVNISEATSFELDDSDRPLLKHLNEPIAASRSHDYGEWIVIGFDPVRSDLPLRAAFPMLVSRVVQRLRPPAATVAPRLWAGRRATVNIRDLDVLLDDGVVVTIVDDKESVTTRATVSAGAIDVTLPVPGIYQLFTNGRAVADVAVMGHGREESELRPRIIDVRERLADQPDTPAPAPAVPWSAIDYPPFFALLALVFASLLVEWRWFHRRRTV